MTSIKTTISMYGFHQVYCKFNADGLMFPGIPKLRDVQHYPNSVLLIFSIL